MTIPEMIYAAALTIGFILVLVVLIRIVRRRGKGINLFLYPVSRSSKAIPDNHAKVRTPPVKR